MSATLGVVGLSHLGTVSSIGLASLGYRVTGIDSDAKAVERLRKGDCIFPEPGLADLMRTHSEKLDFTTDFSALSACDIVVFGEDTIITEQNEMDVSRLHALIDLMIPHLKVGVTILFMSQVPVGFTRALHKKISTHRKGLSFRLFYWVDVLIVGDAVSRFQNPGRIIVGHHTLPGTLPDNVQSLFKAFNCPLFTMNYESAEITKSAVNVYLATTVTFANSLSDLCEAVGADMTHIVPAFRLDKRIGPFAYVKPGLGFSGGHLERDLVALTKLADHHGVGHPLLDLIQDESEKRYRWLVQKIDSLILKKNSSPTIAIWGLSYKKNTDSTHGAPSLKIIRDYGKRATLVAYDPLVKLPGVTSVLDRNAALKDADGLLILSDWDEFKLLQPSELQAMKTSLVIDPLGVLSGTDLPGASYVTMGRA